MPSNPSHLFIQARCHSKPKEAWEHLRSITVSSLDLLSACTIQGTVILNEDHNVTTVYLYVSILLNVHMDTVYRWHLEIHTGFWRKGSPWEKDYSKQRLSNSP